jgi:shikimate dehydrogenase
MQLFGLIGFPLGHSFSKKYFEEKFEREKITDVAFEIFPIPNIHDFNSLIAANPLLKGLAVTIPYKEQVLPFIDKLSEEVMSIGAANCIKIENGILTAFNTDIIGFEESFKKKLQPQHTKALVLGAGGAAKAVQFVLQKMGISFIVVSRTPSAENNSISYFNINEEMMQEYSIIINCTPVGMHPNEQEAPPIPYQLLNANHYLFDLVYKPAKTLFLQKGEAMGSNVENGFDMLLIQAEANWKIWNGK